MTELRLKSTGERLVWKDDVEAEEVSLCRESADVDTWFATISDYAWGVYRTDADPGGKLLGGHDVSFGVEMLQEICEDALVAAGVAEYIAEEEEPFPSD